MAIELPHKLDTKRAAEMNGANNWEAEQDAEFSGTDDLDAERLALMKDANNLATDLRVHMNGASSWEAEWVAKGDGANNLDTGLEQLEKAIEVLHKLDTKRAAALNGANNWGAEQDAEFSGADDLDAERLAGMKGANNLATEPRVEKNGASSLEAEWVAKGEGANNLDAERAWHRLDPVGQCVGRVQQELVQTQAAGNPKKICWYEQFKAVGPPRPKTQSLNNQMLRIARGHLGLFGNMVMGFEEEEEEEEEEGEDYDEDDGYQCWLDEQQWAALEAEEDEKQRKAKIEFL